MAFTWAFFHGHFYKYYFTWNVRLIHLPMEVEVHEG